MKYRKKPVVIDAIQFDGQNHDELRTFVGPQLAMNDGITLSIKTLEGEMLVSVDDYIIKGIKGEFYPCKPNIFESTYELVEEEIDKFQSKE